MKWLVSALSFQGKWLGLKHSTYLKILGAAGWGKKKTGKALAEKSVSREPMETAA